MNSQSRDEMNRAAHEVRIQLLLLHWAGHRFAERQSSQGNHGVERIEHDFKNHCVQYGQEIDFRFDREISLIGVVYFLIVSGLEVASRLDRDCLETIKREVENSIGEYIKISESITIRTMEPLKKGARIDTWTLVKRLRNSLSHARYEYVLNSGMIRFEDFDNQKKQNKQTAEFEMSAFCLYELAYRFGLGFCRAHERM